jgi:site-specific recombinase XerD
MSKKELGMLQEEFIEETRYARRLSEETIRGYESSLRLFSKIFPDIKYPEELCKQLLIRFFRELEIRERKVGKKIKKGIKKSTIATHWSKLNQFFKWLVINKHIEENPLWGIPFPRVEYLDKKYLTHEQVSKIFSAVAFNIKWSNSLIEKRNTMILFLALSCGLRKGEILGLKVTDIDLDRKKVIVRAETSKSKIRREVPLNSTALVKVKFYLDERKKFGLMSEYLLVNEKNEKFTSHGLKHMIAKVKKESGVKFHIHQLRHTFAVNLINNRCDVSKLKILMGHRDIRMTGAYLRCIPTKGMRADLESLTLDNLL